MIDASDMTEQEWINHNRDEMGLYPAKREARGIYITSAIMEAETLDDLKPVLLRLLDGD